MTILNKLIYDPFLDHLKLINSFDPGVITQDLCHDDTPDSEWVIKNLDLNQAITFSINNAGSQDNMLRMLPASLGLGGQRTMDFAPTGFDNHSANWGGINFFGSNESSMRFSDDAVGNLVAFQFNHPTALIKGLRLLDEANPATIIDFILAPSLETGNNAIVSKGVFDLDFVVNHPNCFSFRTDNALADSIILDPGVVTGPNSIIRNFSTALDIQLRASDDIRKVIISERVDLGTGAIDSTGAGDIRMTINMQLDGVGGLTAADCIVFNTALNTTTSTPNTPFNSSVGTKYAHSVNGLFAGVAANIPRAFRIACAVNDNDVATDWNAVTVTDQQGIITTGTVLNYSGLTAQVLTVLGGTITNALSFKAAAPVNFLGGTIVNAVAFQAVGPDVGTSTNWAIQATNPASQSNFEHPVSINQVGGVPAESLDVVGNILASEQVIAYGNIDTVAYSFMLGA